MALKFGFISEVTPQKGLVRVSFPEDNLVSAPIPIIVNGSKDSKFFHQLNINDPVACLMDDCLENGVCLGAIYTEKTLPAANVQNELISLNVGTAKVSISKSGDSVEVKTGTTIIKSTPLGVEISKGGESLKNILTDLVTANVAETHTSAASGSPTSPPLNAAQYSSILARINLFFTA